MEWIEVDSFNKMSSYTPNKGPHQLAAVYCMRCYHASQQHPTSAGSGGRNNVHDNEAHFSDRGEGFSSRVKAMEILGSYADYYSQPEWGYRKFDKLALDACMNCDFSKPNIADLVREESKKPEINKKLEK